MKSCVIYSPAVRDVIRDVNYDGAQRLARLFDANRGEGIVSDTRTCRQRVAISSSD